MPHMLRKNKMSRDETSFLSDTSHNTTRENFFAYDVLLLDGRPFLSFLKHPEHRLAVSILGDADIKKV